jgi:uncharacterized protein YbaA (DUF1428 family)
MPGYVDGFVIPIKKSQVQAYRRMASVAAKVWRDHGALEFRECVGEDFDVHCGVPFPKQVKAKTGETVMFSWIVYRSRAHRDKVNAAVMKDPRLAKMGTTMPFDVDRMVYGGFKILVDGGGPAPARRRTRKKPVRRPRPSPR